MTNADYCGGSVISPDGSRRVLPLGRNERWHIQYRSGDKCKICLSELSIYNRLDVCYACVVKAARKYDEDIEAFVGIKSSILDRVCNELKVGRRVPWDEADEAESQEDDGGAPEAEPAEDEPTEDKSAESEPNEPDDLDEDDEDE